MQFADSLRVQLMRIVVQKFPHLGVPLHAHRTATGYRSGILGRDHFQFKMMAHDVSPCRNPFVVAMHELAANDAAVSGTMMIDEFLDRMPMLIPCSGRHEHVLGRKPIKLGWISHLITVRRPTVMGTDHYLRAFAFAFVGDGSHRGVAAPDDVGPPIHIEAKNSRSRIRLGNLPQQVSEDAFEVWMDGIDRQLFAAFIPAVD